MTVPLPVTSGVMSTVTQVPTVVAPLELSTAEPIAGALFQVLLAGSGLEALLGLLAGPGRTGQHALGADVDVDELHALVGDEELADLVAVRHAAALEDVQRPVALTVALALIK